MSVPDNDTRRNYKVEFEDEDFEFSAVVEFVDCDQMQMKFGGLDPTAVPEEYRKARQSDHWLWFSGRRGPMLIVGHASPIDVVSIKPTTEEPHEPEVEF